MKSFLQYLRESSEDFHDKDFSDLESKLDSMNISHHINHNPKQNLITVSKIVVNKNERGQGKGSEAMRLITDHADKHKKRIALTPSTDFGASSVSRLKNFYKSHGFLENKGRNKDFSISDTMIREPK